MIASTVWAADSGSPRVGWLSSIIGPVQYHSPMGEWADALLNDPVAASAGLRTAKGAEAEWQSRGARIAMAPSSELQVLRLDRDALQVAVTDGRIGVHLDDEDTAKTVEIDLPSGGIWLNAPGDYDIAVGDAHTPAAIQVFAGKVRLGGGLDDRYFAAATPDWFSDWWRSRDNNADLDDPRPWPDVPGVAALSAAGHWELDAKLGNVWFPSDLSGDWTPYRDGVWRFLSPWGWTWIDNASWGFAPSHYGRWARIDGNWAWVPGDKLRATDYSPAVVAFLGTAGIGLSRPGDIGATPAVAWFPLAPGEKLGASGDADGAYQNRRFATAVSRNAFAGGLPVASAMVDDVPTQRFVDAPVILQSLDIPPGTVATKKPVVRIAAAPPVTPEAASEPRPPYVVALRDTPPPPLRPAVRVLVHEIRKHVRVAVAVEIRARPSTSVAHPAHTRAHLAAARRRA